MKTKILVLMMFALATAVASADAGVLEVAPASPISMATTDWADQLIFQQFDSSLGVLERVELLFDGSLTTVLTVTNRSTSASQGRAMTNVYLTVTDGVAEVGTVELVSPTYTYSLPGGGTTTSGLLIGGGSIFLEYAAAADLARFLGSGTVAFDVGSATETFIANNGGNTDVSQQTQAGVTGVVRYIYHTPEPASLALLALGSLVLMRRRRV